MTLFTILGSDNVNYYLFINALLRPLPECVNYLGNRNFKRGGPRRHTHSLERALDVLFTHFMSCVCALYVCAAFGPCELLGEIKRIKHLTQRFSSINRQNEINLLLNVGDFGNRPMEFA